MIPEFAIIGHPNEGKSSVLSTLAEDDSVRISPYPGETTECRTFPVRIDNREILRFVDTPGFQNPRRMLVELQKLEQENVHGNVFQTFIQTYKDTPELKDDCELLTPVVKGAGIIYVVDGSRPLRNVDKAEMEVLRMTGRPRMAILNCKDEEQQYLQDWHHAFRKTFNSNRLFNAHRATYAERIQLLEALKNIDQEWHTTLNTVILAFKQDWEARNDQTANIIINLLDNCLSFKLIRKLREADDEPTVRKELFDKYTRAVKNKEKQAHEQVRALFKHNIFNIELPVHSILHQELFSQKTWHFLGLRRRQMLMLGAIGGAAAGVLIDMATLGSSFGLFGSVGGALGAAGAFMSSKHFTAGTSLMGVKIGRQRLQMGPNESIQFLFVLLDRFFLFYSFIINWAHGRRDYDSSGQTSEELSLVGESQTKQWTTEDLKICHAFFTASKSGDAAKIQQAEKQLKPLIKRTLMALSTSE